MRLLLGEKYRIIKEVTSSEIGFKRTLQSFGIARITFYNGINITLKKDYQGLEPCKRTNGT